MGNGLCFSGHNKPHADNNRIERLNGTLRERVKVQRGWKSYKPTITKSEHINYNFVKPYLALDEKTPAKKSDIQIKVRKSVKIVRIIY
ncbi:MAG: hypothetical protein ACJ72J_00125 [Nitrososphaeraceae archaeon]